MTQDHWPHCGYRSIALMAQAALASAAEIKVFSTIGVKSALEELTPKFEKATGHKLNITWGDCGHSAKSACRQARRADVYGY